MLLAAGLTAPLQALVEYPVRLDVPYGPSGFRHLKSSDLPLKRDSRSLDGHDDVSRLAASGARARVPQNGDMMNRLDELFVLAREIERARSTGAPVDHEKARRLARLVLAFGNEPSRAPAQSSPSVSGFGD